MQNNIILNMQQKMQLITVIHRNSAINFNFKKEINSLTGLIYLLNC